MGTQRVLTILGVILAVGLLLRIWGLTSVPPGMNWDEVSHGYTAWSLLHTGRDQWREVLPFLNFRGYGDYPTTLITYLTVPILAFFGATDFALRLPQVMLGLLTIISSFLGAYFWKKDSRIALLVALFIAIEPWAFFSSRAVFQSNATVLLLSVFLAALFRKKYILSSLILTLSLWSYHNARIFVPLASGWLFLTTRRKVFLIVAAIAVGILVSPISRARGSWVKILDSGAIAYLEEQRNKGGSPFIYNRPLYLAGKVMSNYLGYFSPQFLFLDGGTQYQFSVPNWGVLNLANLPFFYLGLILLPLVSPVIFILLLMSPIPAAITVDKYAVIRSTTMLPMVQMTTAIGIVWILSKIPRKFKSLSIAVYGVLFFASSIMYFVNYFGAYKTSYAASWQYGHKQTVEYIKENYDKYDSIVVTKRYGEPHEFILWNWPWDPDNYSPDWDYHDNWYWVNGFDKFKFVNDWEMKEYPFLKNSLIVASPDNIPTGTMLKTIDYPAGGQVFVILEK